MHGTLAETLLYYDRIAWFYINYQWRNGLLDAVLPFLRNQWFWVPLYFFLATYMPVRYRRSGLFWCLGFILSFVITDQITASWLKPHFQRLRPCFDPSLANIVHMMVPRGGMYSFPSSHAANHFAIGIFSAVTLGSRHKWLWPAAIIWAASICYAQVYVGVHFPLDVLVGGLIGTISGIFTGSVFNKLVKLDALPGDKTTGQTV
jgi:undecaprenyl-diphosphatase